MKLAIVAVTAFFGALVGGASGSALLTHPEWFGVSRTSAAPEADAADRGRTEEARRREEERRAPEAERKRADEERRRREEEARRRDEGRREPQRGVSCEYAPSALRGAFASEMDCFFVDRLFRITMETARDGSAGSNWGNPRSGASGWIRVLATIPKSDGVTCRRFEQSVIVNGRRSTATGTACFRDQRWQIEA